MSSYKGLWDGPEEYHMYFISRRTYNTLTKMEIKDVSLPPCIPSSSDNNIANVRLEEGCPDDILFERALHMLRVPFERRLYTDNQQGLKEWTHFSVETSDYSQSKESQSYIKDLQRITKLCREGNLGEMEEHLRKFGDDFLPHPDFDLECEKISSWTAMIFQAVTGEEVTIPHDKNNECIADCIRNGSLFDAVETYIHDADIVRRILNSAALALVDSTEKINFGELKGDSNSSNQISIATLILNHSSFNREDIDSIAHLLWQENPIDRLVDQVVQEVLDVRRDFFFSSVVKNLEDKSLLPISPSNTDKLIKLGGHLSLNERLSKDGLGRCLRGVNVLRVSALSRKAVEVKPAIAPSKSLRL